MSAPEPLSPLAHRLEIGTFGAERPEVPVQISEVKQAVVRLMMHPDELATVSAEIEKDTGLRLPRTGHAASSGDMTAIWVGPHAWLLVQPWPLATDLATRVSRLCGRHCSVIDQSGGHVTLRVSGPHARDVLAKGCRIDLHPRAFGPERAAATPIAHVQGIIWQVNEAPTFELIVPSTLGEHVFEWLCLSAAEFGYEVGA